MNRTSRTLLPVEVRSQLRGIVAIWFTNGQQPVDGGNDTRYEFFSGGWTEAAFATQELIELGYVELVKDEVTVKPTALGIFKAIS